MTQTFAIEVPDAVQIMRQLRVVQLHEIDYPDNHITLTWAGVDDRWCAPDPESPLVPCLSFDIKTHESLFAAEAAACAVINLRARYRIACEAARSAVEGNR